MDYLIRNELLLREIGRIDLKRGTLIERSGMPGGGFITSLGSCNSPTYGICHVALKEKERGIIERVYFNLLLLQSIWNGAPSLRDEIPLFYGLVRRRTGEFLGEIIEDFSEGRKFEIQDASHMHEPSLPLAELEACFACSIGRGQLTESIFYANGRRRIGDLENLNIAGVPMPDFSLDFESELDKHTVIVDF